MSNSNSWWSGKINHENFFFFFFPHFHYSSDVPTSKFGISIRRMEFFIGFLKFFPMRCRIVCIYLDELFRMLCQGWINLSKGAKGIFKFEMVVYWQKGICLPLSALPSEIRCSLTRIYLSRWYQIFYSTFYNSCNFCLCHLSNVFFE